MKAEITLFEGPKVEADVSKVGLIGVHRPVGGGAGYILTHILSGKVVCRTILKRTALGFRKELEGLSGAEFEARVIRFLTGDKEVNSKSETEPSEDTKEDL